MTNEKQPPTLVSIDCAKKGDVPEIHPAKEHLLNFADRLVDMIDGDEIVHLVCSYESPDGEISTSFVGLSDNYYRMHWALNNVVPDQYEGFHILAEEEYDE